MSQAQQAADDAGALLLGRALAMIAESAVLIIVVRLLGKAEVGALAGLLVVCQTVAIVATAGMPASLLMMLPGQTVGVRRALARQHLVALHLLGVLAGVALAGYAVAARAGWIDDPESADLLWMLPYPLFDLPARALPNLLVVEGRARVSAQLAVGKSLLTSAATLVPVALGLPVWQVALCVTAAAGLNWAVVPLAFARLYRDAPAQLGAPAVGVGGVLRHALPLGLTDIVGAIAQRLDRHLVLFFFSAEVFAEYQVGAWQIPLIVNVPYAVGTACAAPMRQLFGQDRGAEAIALWQASIRKVSLVVVPVSMVFLVAAPAVVELLFTAEYVRAVPVFRCYTALTMMRVAAFGIVLVAAARPRDVLVSAVASLGFAVLLQLPLALALGPVGPALGAVLAFFPTVAIYTVQIARAAGTSRWRTFPLGDYARLCLWAAVPGVLAHLVVAAIAPGPVVALLLTAVIVLGGFAVLATRAKDMGTAEWRYLGRWLRLRQLQR